VIAGSPDRGSLMPMGDGTYCLGVLKAIQEAAGVGQGDTIEVAIELDAAPPSFVDYAPGPYPRPFPKGATLPA